MSRHLAGLIIIFLLITNLVSANDEIPNGNVIVESKPDYTKSYKDRRNTHGFLFAVHSESFDPVNYMSQLNTGGIGDLIGQETISLNGIELGYKYNVGIFSLAGIYSYSLGGVSGSGADLNFTKQSASANIALDAILDEPWVVPYFQIGFQIYI
jgi:hypothetical protein